jgi:hypothetical protein
MEHASLDMGLVLSPSLILFVNDGQMFRTATRVYKFNVRNIVRKVLPQPCAIHVGSECLMTYIIAH